MSNLVVPQSYVNPTLEANLKAFFNRYPYEKARLEETLRKPAPLFQLDEIEVPAAPSKPPMRVILLTGIGNPVFLGTLLSDSTVQRENFRLFIFENDPEFIAFCFQNADLTQIINYEKAEWFLLHSVDSVKPALFRALKPEHVTSLMLNVQILNVIDARLPEAAGFYQQLATAYRETCSHVFHNHGNLDDSLLGVEVTVRNKDWLLSAPGVSTLKDHYKGMSALVVGAGPSLDQNLEKIKKYNDRFIVIAADAALKPLVNAGIRVDFVTSIERLNSYQKPFFEGLEEVSADLVAFPVVHPEVLDLYPGQVRIVYRNYSFYAYFEKSFPKGILRCGGSTSHLGFRLADYFGCRKIFLVGIDSTYEEKDGLYRSHCSGTGHPDWGNYIPLEDFQTKRTHAPTLTMKANDGSDVVTNITYYQWAKEYGEELGYIGQRATVSNCSAKGLPILGVPYVDLAEAAEKLDPVDPTKPEDSKVIYYRSWDNKELVKNLEGFLIQAERSIDEAEALQAFETVPEDRFAALMYMFMRCCNDDMFVAFVIQCCATRFFELENKWWSYGLTPNTDMHEKCQVLKERFELFQETLTRLIKIFKEEGNPNG